MKLNDTARLLIGSTPTTLVTINRDGSPQVSVFWMVVQSTSDGDDQLVTAKRMRNPPRRTRTQPLTPRDNANDRCTRFSEEPVSSRRAVSPTEAGSTARGPLSLSPHGRLDGL
jgi:hypothetical protein